MSTGGARHRDRDGTGSPTGRLRYMAVQVASGEPPSPNGRQARDVAPDAARGRPEGAPHGDSGSLFALAEARGLSPGAWVVTVLCVVAATALLWAAFAGLVWIAWRLAGG